MFFELLENWADETLHTISLVHWLAGVRKRKTVRFLFYSDDSNFVLKFVVQFSNMSGLYIHIPFCKQACNYCNFHFSTSLQHVDAIIEAMVQEIQQKSVLIAQKPIQTIYLGGGSPSILNRKQLQKIFEAIAPFIDMRWVQEVTLEANPDDMLSDKLKDWLAFGVNRLSIGVQSFRDQDLRFMNRAHNSVEAIKAIELAQKLGFNNVSIDLIYGLPGLSEQNWLANLQQAIALNVPHVSSYCLTVEPKTALAYQIKNKGVAAPNDDMANQHFELLIDELAKHGIEQYEISNFAKRGFESKHNSAYWKGTHYIGIGPGAHSFDGKNRYWNISNNQLYKQALERGSVYFEEESLSMADQFNEYIMTSIRTREGMSKLKLQELKTQIEAKDFAKNLNKWVQNGSILENDTHFFLSKEARFFADGIASDLFLSNLT